MKYIFTIGAFIAFSMFATATFAETKQIGDYSLTLKATRNGSTYKIGETADFRFFVSKVGVPLDNLEVSGSITKEAEPLDRNFRTKTKNGAVVVSEKLGEAGFLRCTVKVKVPNKDGKIADVMLVAGAAFSPEKIVASLPKPDDFDAYWDKQKKLLAAVPLNLRMTPVKWSDESVELFDVRADMPHGMLSGYLAKPKGAAKGSLPAIILPHGAGVRSARADSAVSWAKCGLLALDFNAHGVPNGMDTAFYKTLAFGELKGHYLLGVENRDKTYMRKIYLRALRALDVLMSQPEWNGKDLASYGTSQGGAQSIAVAGLSDKITFAMIVVPGMCDNTAFKVGRSVGGGRFVRENWSPKINYAAIESSRYIDCVNFARNIKCPTVWNVSYADTTCVPSSCCAAYNVVKAPKEILFNEEYGHSVEKIANELKEICIKHILNK